MVDSVSSLSTAWRAHLKFLLFYPAVTVAVPAALAVFYPAYGFLALMALALGGAGYFVVFSGDLRADSMAASVYAGSTSPRHHANPSSPLGDRWPLYYAAGVGILSIAALVVLGVSGA